jgi:hypothetical protein
MDGTFPQSDGCSIQTDGTFSQLDECSTRMDGTFPKTAGTFPVRLEHSPHRTEHSPGEGSGLPALATAPRKGGDIPPPRRSLVPFGGEFPKADGTFSRRYGRSPWMGETFGKGRGCLGTRPHCRDAPWGVSGAATSAVFSRTLRGGRTVANWIVLSASETPHGASLQWKYPFELVYALRQAQILSPLSDGSQASSPVNSDSPREIPFSTLPCGGVDD